MPRSPNSVHFFEPEVRPFAKTFSCRLKQFFFLRTHFTEFAVRLYELVALLRCVGNLLIILLLQLSGFCPDLGWVKVIHVEVQELAGNLFILSVRNLSVLLDDFAISLQVALHQLLVSLVGPKKFSCEPLFVL